MQKAAFYKLKSNGEREGRGISVMFNPESYSVSSSAVYYPSFSPQKRVEILQFSNIRARTLSMELLFDAMNDPDDDIETLKSSAVLKNIFLDVTKDVRDKVKELRSMIELTDGEKSPPPVVEFQWGGFVFRGVTDSFKENYTMFHSDGRPIKATVSISMTEYPYGAMKMTNKPISAEKSAKKSVGSSREKSYAQKAEAALKKIK